MVNLTIQQMIGFALIAAVILIAIAFATGFISFGTEQVIADLIK